MARRRPSWPTKTQDGNQGGQNGLQTSKELIASTRSASCPHGEQLDGQRQKRRAKLQGLDEHVETTSGYVSIGTMHLAKGRNPNRGGDGLRRRDHPLAPGIETVSDDSDCRRSTILSAICFTLPARVREITCSSRVLNRRPSSSMICGCEPHLLVFDGIVSLTNSLRSQHDNLSSSRGAKMRLIYWLFWRKLLRKYPFGLMERKDKGKFRPK